MSNWIFSHGCPAYPSTVTDTSTKPAYAASSVAFDRLVRKQKYTSRFVQAPKTVVNMGEVALVALSSMVAPPPLPPLPLITDSSLRRCASSLSLRCAPASLRCAARRCFAWLRHATHRGGAEPKVAPCPPVDGATPNRASPRPFRARAPGTPSLPLLRSLPPRSRRPVESAHSRPVPNGSGPVHAVRPECPYHWAVYP